MPRVAVTTYADAHATQRLATFRAASRRSFLSSLPADIAACRHFLDVAHAFSAAIHARLAAGAILRHYICSRTLRRQMRAMPTLLGDDEESRLDGHGHYSLERFRAHVSSLTTTKMALHMPPAARAASHKCDLLLFRGHYYDVPSRHAKIVSLRGRLSTFLLIYSACDVAASMYSGRFSLAIISRSPFIS